MDEKNKIENQKLTFKLATFEGPLDLLLHLIKENQMDIYDISMATITSQYIDYLHQMQTLELDIAGEYLVTAAMLLNIKSRMLLPNEQAQESEEFDDPREELVQQLILHQTFQMAAGKFKDYASERQKSTSREQEPVPSDAKLGQLKQGTSVYELQHAFARLITKKQLSRPVTRQVHIERYTLKEEMVRLKARIFTTKNAIEFTEVVSDETDTEQLVTVFLALLELIKRGAVIVSQATTLGPIIMRSGEDNALESS